MASVQEIVTAASIDADLLAALKTAVPEQIGDDLVLRLPDGRVFYIDGFFAADETGDGLPPLPGALPLSRDVADLLLGATDIETAAGGEQEPVPPPNSATFETFAPDAALPDGPAPLNKPNDTKGDEDELARNGAGSDSRARALHDDNNSFGGLAGPAPLSSSAIGTISLAAGSLGAPTWSGPFDIRYLFRVEELADAATAGWFSGLTKAKPISAPLDFDAFLLRFDPIQVAGGGITRFDYAHYLALHDDVVSFADGRTLWANVGAYADALGTRDNSLATALPPGTTPAQVFAGNDFIIGAAPGVDRLYGFAGDDILIGYAGENHLFGGDGNDLLITSLGLTPREIAGGDGDDTLMLVIDLMYQITASQLGPISSIERLVLMPQNENNPTFLSDDFDGGRLIPGSLVFEIDAATILAWGGNLTIDSNVADVRFSDIGAWTRLPTDSGDPAYVHYQAQIGGQAVSLAILASADQPIADAVIGTNGDDIFFLGNRVFNSFDGAGGTDQIQGGTKGGPVGVLDLQDADTVPFRNIESILLADAADQVIVSAPSIAAMTDARNTLWVTGAGTGNGAEASFLYHQGKATGQVDLVDPTAWTALGYLSIQTAPLPFAEMRMGAIYGATIGTENVYLFVQLGIEQPIAAATTNIDHWFVNHGGWVYLPPDGTILDLAVIDLGNGLTNFLMLDVASAAALTGVDGSISLIGDAGLDTVQFADMSNWQFSHVDGGFSVYLGDDGAGHQVELRVATTLVQPDLLPDTSSGDLDFINLSNGHANLLALDVDSARELAGADKLLYIYGDASSDKVIFDDPANWTLLKRDGSALIYEGDDGSGTVQIGIQASVDHPTLTPHATDGNDSLAVTNLQYLEQVAPVDGKDGFDTLHLLDAGDIFSRVDSILNFEVIDLTNGVGNRFFLSAKTVAENMDSGPLLITGDATDSVMLSPASLASTNYAWFDTHTTMTHGGKTFDIYQAQVPTSSFDLIVQVAVDRTMLHPEFV